MKNPYVPPKSHSRSPATSANLRTIGLVASTIGILTILYGATAFWLMPQLPPNGGSYGRLPSMLILGIGIVITIVGMAINSLATQNQQSAASPKKIPAFYGFAAIGLILLIVFIIVANM